MKINYIEKLLKINRILSIKFRTHKIISYEKQKYFIDQLGTPKDEIERSYFQYNCKNYIFRKSCIFIFIRNLVSFFILIYFYITLSLRKNKTFEKKDAIFVYNGDGNRVLPIDYKEKVKCCRLEEGAILNKEDRSFFWKVVERYPFSFYFLLRNLLKISIYSYIISRYLPSTILCSCEYSDTSSILTKYCEEKKIKHVNVMHGELFFEIQKAFSKFHYFYIWDSYYQELCKSLKIDAIYKNYKPEILRVDFNKFDLKEKDIIDVTFYLQLETKQTLEKIKQKCEELKKINKKYVLRPHPIYTDLKLLKSFFNEKYIEDREITIKRSIFRTKYIVSRFSTVLYEAYLLNKEIVIDDCSNEAEFKNLKKLKYIMLNKKHLLLSNLVREMNK